MDSGLSGNRAVRLVMSLGLLRHANPVDIIIIIGSILGAIASRSETTRESQARFGTQREICGTWRSDVPINLA
jgi:hypothetical protein